MKPAIMKHDQPGRSALGSPSLSRRVFLGGVTGAFGALMLPRAPRATESEPHFFLQIVFTGGMDPNYLFDARPLALTAAGLQHNYLAEEPTEWAGSNGAKTLAASPAAPLRPFQADLAIINGVVMTPSFDGHDQNLNVLLTGNPFGGRSLLSRLNQERPVDFLKLGPLVGLDLEDTRYVPLGANVARQLQTSLTATSGLPPDFNAFLEGGYAAAGAGPGRFSSGSRALLDAVRQSPVLEARLRSLQLPGPEVPEGLGQELGMVAEFFRRRVCQSALIDLTGPLRFDVHAKDAARLQAPLYLAATAMLAQIFAFLKQTPFDDRSTLLDVTTVLVASEFGRTMRQEGLRIDDTGTDHNPLANTIIAAGKGIRGGVVLGGTDINSADEPLSGAHLALDGKKLKRMGRPVDWVTGLPTEEAPAAYAPEKYLGIASVVNTVYSLFGVDPKLYWQSGRDAPAAPVLVGLRA